MKMLLPIGVELTLQFFTFVFVMAQFMEMPFDSGFNVD